MRRFWVVLTFFIAVVTSVLIFSLKQTPIYEATTSLLIERKSPQVISVKEVTPMGAENSAAYKEYYETQYKLIKSRAVLSKVAKSLGYEVNKFSEESSSNQAANVFGLKAKKYSQKGDFIEKLSKAITVKPIQYSRLVEISAEDSSPGMAAKIANSVANEYIHQNLEGSIKVIADASKWLSKRIEEQGLKLKESELALQAYREKNNIKTVPQETFGDSGIDIIKAEYAKSQALLESYAKRYTDLHPKVVELKAKTNSLKNKIYGLEDADIGNKTMEYRILEREVQTNKRLYESLLVRLKELNLSSTLDSNNIRVIDRAFVPDKPIRPNIILNLILAVVVGLVLGIGLSIVIDYLDTTIKSPKDIQELLKSPFLGSIPRITEKNKSKKSIITYFQPQSILSEAYKNLCAEILFAIRKDETPKAILVISSEPQAGKTTTVVNLAIVLTQLGKKVLIVDSDFRRSQIHKVFNLDENDGLYDYLNKSITLNSIIKDTRIENLKAVTAGNTDHNPVERFGSSKMAKFIREAKQKFDFVLFDSPPLASVAESVILADMVDILMQVVRSNKTLLSMASRTKEKLANVRAHNLGIVLNDFKAHYGDGYYQYYNYYGKKVKNTQKTKKEKQLVNEVEKLAKL